MLVALQIDGGKEFHRGITLDTKECRCEVDQQVGTFSVSEWTCLRLGEGWGVKKKEGMMEWPPTMRQQGPNFCFALLVLREDQSSSGRR